MINDTEAAIRAALTYARAQQLTATAFSVRHPLDGTELVCVCLIDASANFYEDFTGLERQIPAAIYASIERYQQHKSDDQNRNKTGKSLT